jgi:hypothetical protein
MSYTTRPPSFENLEEPQLSAVGVTECNDYSGCSDFSTFRVRAKPPDKNGKKYRSRPKSFENPAVIS